MKPPKKKVIEKQVGSVLCLCPFIVSSAIVFDATTTTWCFVVVSGNPTTVFYVIVMSLDSSDKKCGKW